MNCANWRNCRNWFSLPSGEPAPPPSGSQESADTDFDQVKSANSTFTAADTPSKPSAHQTDEARAEPTPATPKLATASLSQTGSFLSSNDEIEDIDGDNTSDYITPSDASPQIVKNLQSQAEQFERFGEPTAATEPNKEIFQTTAEFNLETNQLGNEDDDQYHLTTADKKLDMVYGDHVHQNNDRHLLGGIADDKLWQMRWKRIVQSYLRRYNVPKGPVGNRFVSLLAEEFRQVRDRTSNSERALLFAPLVLQRVPGVHTAHDIRARIEARMDMWEQGLFDGLVHDTILNSRHSPMQQQTDNEQICQQYNPQVLSGRLRPAVRHITDRDKGKVLQAKDLCTKTGKPVIEVLQSKHPSLQMPNGRSNLFQMNDPPPEIIPLDITADTVKAVASRLSGAAGPSGTDAIELRNWLL